MHAVIKVNYQDLKLTFELCCTNYLLINPTKTKVMVFGVPQLVSKLPQDINFTLMDKQLTISSNAKDLGVTLDPYLNYNDHVANVVSSCMRALVQINRVRHLFKREILIKIIYSVNYITVLQFGHQHLKRILESFSVFKISLLG